MTTESQHPRDRTIVQIGRFRLTLTSRPLLVVSAAAAATGAAIAPPLSSRLFAMTPAPAADTRDLWIVAGVWLLTSLVLTLGRARPIKQRLAAVLLGATAVLGAELAVRFAVVHLASDAARAHVIQIEQSAYPLHTRHIAHPFLEYIGNPLHSRGNNLGFSGRDFAYAKDEGVVRVACVGGSTTESGYPVQLEDYLNEHGVTEQVLYEAFNFGVSGWSSFQVSINFMLNVTDFDPDYVVIHSAWNDFDRQLDPCDRGDLMYIIGARGLEEGPGLLEGWALHLSVIYRLSRERLLPLIRSRQDDTPNIQTPDQDPRLCPQRDGHWAYRRNIRNTVDLALAHGIRPVLTTQPYTTDPALADEDVAVHVDACNAFVRTLAQEYGDEVVLADLDEKMTGSENAEFIDFGHLTVQGRGVKARYIGSAILRDRSARSTRDTLWPEPPPDAAAD